MIARIRQKAAFWQQAITTWLIGGIFQSAWAKLPTVDTLAKGYAEKGDWLSILHIYVKEVGLILGLTLSVLSFAWIAYATLSKFDECRKNKAEWVELGVLVITGCGVLMFMALLLGSVDKVVGKTEYIGKTAIQEPVKKE